VHLAPREPGVVEASNLLIRDGMSHQHLDALFHPPGSSPPNVKSELLERALLYRAGVTGK